VRGSPELGAVLRQVRASQSLSQTQVASRVCCDASLVSMVESGKRVLQPDLARRLDHLFGTGTMISALAGSLTTPDRRGVRPWTRAATSSWSSYLCEVSRCRSPDARC
jgi:transcriptional regulator with XRE-family HTH domain